MSLGDWYLALFSMGVAVAIAGYWATARRDDVGHVAAELATAVVLFVVGLAMIFGNEDARWVQLLLAVGLGMLVYTLIESPGRYPGERHMRLAFAVGWLFTIPALVVLFV